MKLTPAYIASQVLTCEFSYDGTYTVCTITTRHGSKHTGTSGCLDPANYSREIGEQIAHKNALDQLWALEGYVVSKLGLSLVPGELTELSAVSPSPAQVGTAETWKRSVTVDFTTARKTGQPNPDLERVVIKEGQHNTEWLKEHAKKFPYKRDTTKGQSAKSALEEVYACGGTVAPRSSSIADNFSYCQYPLPKDVFDRLLANNGLAGLKPTVNVVNTNTARLYIAPPELAARLESEPNFGRDVIAVILANKHKLGL